MWVTVRKQLANMALAAVVLVACWFIASLVAGAARLPVWMIGAPLLLGSIYAWAKLDPARFH